MPNDMTFAQHINKAQIQAMRDDENMLSFGLGIDDPKRIFATTEGLSEEFGNERVFDMPTAENAMTGVGIGAAIAGSRVLMTHQRVDFFLLAMDQLVNNAAKWHYMFDGKMNVPLTIRLIIGRGWGQGPTHAQSLQAWFAHVPGLKVVMPSTPEDAGHLLYQSIMDNNPVVFLEHRWLHNQFSLEISPSESASLPIGKAKVLKQGDDITIVAMSYLTIEALRACDSLQESNINAELIDLRSVRPIDWETIHSSVSKTRRLLVLDTGVSTVSVAAEIIAKVAELQFSELDSSPQRLAMPDIPEPTSYGLTKEFYVGAKEIAQSAHLMVKGEASIYDDLSCVGHHDVPGEYFKGPF